MSLWVAWGSDRDKVSVPRFAFMQRRFSVVCHRCLSYEPPAWQESLALILSKDSVVLQELVVANIHADPAARLLSQALTHCPLQSSHGTVGKLGQLTAISYVFLKSTLVAAGL